MAGSIVRRGSITGQVWVFPSSKILALSGTAFFASSDLIASAQDLSTGLPVCHTGAPFSLIGDQESSIY